VVAARAVALPSFGWFVAEGGGTLARDLSAAALAEALQAELAEWRSGRRDPARIATRWGTLLHAPAVARKLLEIKREAQSGS
jgi:hypothetical protein